MKAGVYTDMDNAAYHSSEGISKSGLDMIATSPAVFQWAKTAPRDEEKLKAMDMGTALHCIILEPEEFADRFIISPSFNLRTNDGKTEKKAFLEDCESLGKTIMDAEEGRLLNIMKESVMAHPVARYLMESEGQNETSLYWNDEDTGELCKCRPDRMLNDYTTIIDVKKVADMERFTRHVEEFRYHVQDAFYSEGYRAIYGEEPTFLFLAVSSTVNAGRYPVEVFDLTPDWKAAGSDLYKRDLATYHECKQNNDWLHIHTLERPRWAK
jgi:exodeoxyribonuclease VIII